MLESIRIFINIFINHSLKYVLCIYVLLKLTFEINTYKKMKYSYLFNDNDYFFYKT